MNFLVADSDGMEGVFSFFLIPSTREVGRTFCFRGWGIFTIFTTRSSKPMQGQNFLLVS
ncbi:protein of unknown function [Burkholderia multivorans]